MTQKGTDLNKSTLLSDESAARAGLGSDAVPDDMWKKIIPTGAIFWLAAETAPGGFLICDGSSLLTEDYPDLYAVIGTAFGSASNGFKLPDLRAAFIRGAGSNNGYSATFSSKQDGSYPSLTNTSNGVSSEIRINVSGSDKNISSVSNAYVTSGGTTHYGGDGGAMRPYNIALTPIIKY